MNLERELENYIILANNAIAKYLPASDINAVSEAMNYSVTCGGKRVRPVILIASAAAFGENIENALPFAAALEMIHTYSLIHDDLPAMDDDDYRRGKPSCHKKYGEANAILAGDALLNRAFEVMIRAVCECNAQHVKTYSEAARIIADAAGINGMISGQAADILYENQSVSEQTLVYINEMKTGALISAAFEAGAVLGGADKECSKAFAAAGKNVGKAFQIRDDMLDSEGRFEEIGKPVGSDEKNNKTTYLTLLGRKKCIKTVAELTEAAAAHLKTAPADTAFLVKLIRDLTGRSK